jgi:hypothetical protein
MTPTANELFGRIAAAAGSSDGKGNPSIEVSVTSVSEAHSTKNRLVGIRKNLRLIKRECNLIQAKIRMEYVSSDGDFLTELFERNHELAFDSRSKGALGLKKRGLLSLYKRTNLIIDEFALKIEGMISQLEGYIARNS